MLVSNAGVEMRISTFGIRVFSCLVLMTGSAFATVGPWQSVPASMGYPEPNSGSGNPWTGASASVLSITYNYVSGPVGSGNSAWMMPLGPFVTSASTQWVQLWAIGGPSGGNASTGHEEAFTFDSLGNMVSSASSGSGSSIAILPLPTDGTVLVRTVYNIAAGVSTPRLTAIEYRVCSNSTCT